MISRPIPDDLLLTGFKIVFEIAVVLTAVRFRHEKLDVLPDELFGGISEHQLSGRIDVFDQTGAVDGDNAINSRLENGLQPGFAAL